MPEVRVLTDTYDQVASQVVTALVQRAVMTALSESKTPPLAELPNSVRPASFANVPLEASGAAAIKPPEIAVVDVLGGKKTNPVIAMYAAGIAVMFVLFSATTASGSLLEERENSTLDRLLCSRLTMDQLLLGKWAYLTLIGVIQMTLMFTWGAVVFGIELLSHWEGFTALTIVTAGAAASFALFLASLCRTRTQLGWISTIVILTMSALGGSMVPRYLMSENIQRIGMITFNAWALEGYNKVFWRDLGLRDLEWELGVMTLCGLVFILSARLFAVRWERT
jgi:ABC-2 type transport system permease protein